MESISWPSYLIPTISFSLSNALSNKIRVTPFPRRRFRARFRSQRMFVFSKMSSFRDFQDYAKPRQLLPTTEPELFVDSSLEKIVSSSQLDGSQCLYKVFLCTSSNYGSDLSDLNAGILICLIGENGASILQRIPAILHNGDTVLFQRGSTDEFIFTGPKLGKIEALWISVESGTWRLAGTNLTMISAHHNQSEEPNTDEYLYHTVSYNFEFEDILLGEGGDITMTEILPSSVIQYCGPDSISLTNITSLTQSASLAEKAITKEVGMKEYANLKYSLLLYDAVLILAGTSISFFTAGENTSLAFLTGGLTGFLYLAFLQRSVDVLSAQEVISVNEGSDFDRLVGRVKGPLLVLALVFGIGVLAVRREVPEIEAGLTPKDIVVGMMGFLACKVSVVLAAFKPISIGIEENE